MLISYLCGICQTLQILSLFGCMALGAHLFITLVQNCIAQTSTYEENRKQIVIPKTEKVLCVIFLLLALFIPSNLKWDLIDSYREEIKQYKQMVQNRDEQIDEFKIFLEVNNLEEKYIKFDTTYKLDIERL